MKTERRTVKVGELIEDMDLYPRAHIDSTHAQHIAEAIEAGVVMPAMICDGSLRIVDGFHRRRAYVRCFSEDYEVEVEVRHYKSDADLLLDAIALNAAHGRNITTCDRVRCIQLAQRFDISTDRVCAALNITTEKFGELTSERLARMRPSATLGDRQVPLKFPVRHLAGRTLTAAQADAMPTLGGNQQTFYVNQLIRLIETNMLDRENPRLIERLTVLAGLLETVCAVSV